MAFITEWNQAAGNFTLPLRSGYTYNMTVSWGDGTADSTVTAYNAASATHNYAAAGTYQISITGTCGAWYINNIAAIKAKLTKVIDWGSVGFATLGLESAFYGCSNLTVLPSTPIVAAAGLSSLKYLFLNCTGLTAIPSGIFDNLTGVTTFQGTFSGCTGLTGSIPVDLFRYNTAAYDYAFQSTFQGCNHLTGAIPTDLFRYNTTVRNLAFVSTFSGCTGLTGSIPTDFFRYNTNARSFQNTFQNCSGLTGSIPAGMFNYNTLATDFSSVFSGCIGLTGSIPTDLFRYNTACTTFSNSFASCSGLTGSIPTDFFRYNTACTSLASVFTSCSGLTGSIPTDLFRYNTLVSDLSALFQNCSGLTGSIPTDLFRYNTACTTLAYIFSGCSGLTGSIPVDLFRYNTLSTSFSQAFKGCSSLTGAIPAGLFDYNTLVTSFYQTFYNCTGLSDSPAGLLRNNTANLNFLETFSGCTSLKLNRNIFYSDGEEATRFLNKSVNFTSCFSRTSYLGILGEAPELWNCSFGTGTPTKTNCFTGSGISITSVSNYCFIPLSWGAAAHCQILNNITAERVDASTQKLTLNTYRDTAQGETIQCYFSLTLTGLVAPGNLVTLTKINALKYEVLLTVGAADALFYTHVSVTDSEAVVFENLDFSAFHYTVQQVATQTINITDPANHLTFTSPLQNHKFNHGLLHYNGYLYGSARDGSGYQLFKINASDYSEVTQTKVYAHPNTNFSSLGTLDQIVSCSGFLWVQCYDYDGLAGLLIRINPADLSYMLFFIDECKHGQPIGTDGTNLYVTSSDAVSKMDTSLLIGAPSSYGYTGSQAVNLPANTILGTCAIIQHHPNVNDPTNGQFVKVYSHSIAIDSNFVYLELTTGIQFNGYDEGLDIYSYHLQKINKTTMITAGDVIIPKCTDDMVQNDTYLFLGPEIQSTTLPITGNSWGLIAINKSTLEIKYLKALHADFNTTDELDRQCFGVFYFGNYLTVQLVNSKKTVVIDLANIESWGASFPIGGATKSIFKYQVNGVDLAAAPNELVLDSSSFIHINTWETNTQVLKFSIADIIPELAPTYNAISLSNSDTVALLQIINEKFGASVRCVQDAPGVATGTAGTATDQDGNTYDTIVINEKRWFVQSLKTTKFRNGDTIPNLAAALDWEQTVAAAHCAPNGETSKI
jgi:hypothetical protein